MTIKQLGGVFGRNPTFNNVTIDGELIINGSVFTGLDYEGAWNAATNTPTLTSSVGTLGQFYIVSVAGATDLNGITNWDVGDWALFNGSVWQRVEGGANGNFSTLSVSGLSSLNGGVNVTGDVVNSGGLYSTVNNSLKIIGGGNASNAGSNLTLYGGTNASAGTFRFRNGTSVLTSITPTGIDVTGSVTADGLTVETTTPSVILSETDRTDENTQLLNASGDFRIRTRSDDGATNTDRFRIDHSTGDISFYNDAAAQGLFWDSSASQLGLGTTTPTYLMHLKDSNGADLALSNSTALPSAGDYLGRIYALDNGDNFFAGINMFYHDADDGEIRFRVKTAGTNADVMTLVDGNVGIGTSSPDGGLDIEKTVNTAWSSALRANDFLQISNVSTTGGSYSGIELIATGVGAAGAAEIVCIDSGSGSGDLAFSTRNSSTWSEKVRILAGGNVGIGTNTPLYTAASRTTTTINGTSSANLSFGVGGTGYANLYADASSVKFGSQTAANPINFTIGGATKATLDASGKILIGDSASHTSDLLQIETPASGGGHGIQIRRNDSNTDQGVGSITFGNNTATDLASIYAKTDGATDNGALLFNTSVSGGANTERMRIDASGNLLVGKTSVAFSTAGIELKADNVISITRSAGTVINANRIGSSAGSLIIMHYDGVDVGSIDVTASATSYTTSSDQRLKENIADADDAGAKIDAIQVRKFDWKVDGSHQDYGMVAQELQSVAPEAVSQGETEDDMMGVDYSKLVPMMLKEIQSLRARIAALES